MKKMKTLLLTLALGFTLAGAATAVACGGDKGSAPATSSDYFAGQEESLVFVKFSALKLDIAKYETYQLNCSVSGTIKAPTFTSSDSSIVSVDQNGLVTTKGVLGSVVITATVEGVSATCEINVVETAYVPVIVTENDQFSVENGSTLKFEVATEWNQAVLNEEIEYSVSFAENSQDAQAEISVDGNVVSVVTNGVETFDLLISTTVRDVYTSKLVTVVVAEPKLNIASVSSAFKPGEQKFVVELSPTDEVGTMAKSVDLDFVVTKGDEILNDVAIDWQITSLDNGAEEDDVKIEGKTLIGQRRGEATLVGTAVYQGETVKVVVDCSIIAPVVHVDEQLVLDVEDLADPIDPKVVTLETMLIGDSVMDVTLHGKSIKSKTAISGTGSAKTVRIKFDADKFPLKASLLGEQTVVVDTDKVSYTFDALIYTMIINDADELDKMKSLSYTGEEEWNMREGYEGMHSSEYFDGYFVLGNDIDYNREFMSFTDSGKVWWCQGTSDDLARGFIGIFDGQGYNIDGMTVGLNPSGSGQSGGIFGYLAKTGIVKNVSFTNATLYANQGFICAYGDGTIENVSIIYKKIGGDKETAGINGSSPMYMGSFFSRKAGTNANVKNCLIDASAADITVEHGKYNGQTRLSIKLVGSATSIENVIVICPNQEVLNASGADIKKFTNVDAMSDAKLMKNFDEEIWTTVDGIPMFKNQAAKLDKDAPIDFVTTQTTLVAGFELLIMVNNPYTVIEMEEVEGVAFKNSILTADDSAWKKTVTLTATSLLNPSIKATYEVYIDSFGETIASPAEEKIMVYNSNPVVSIGDNSWKSAKNYVYLNENVIGQSEGTTEDLLVDWLKLGWGESQVTIVSEDETGARKNFVATVDVDYVKADFNVEGKVVVSDSAFSSVRSSNKDGSVAYTLVDVEDTKEKAPAGYSSVTQLDCDTAWWTALAANFFYQGDMSAYSDFWFAVKISGGRWVMGGTNRNELANTWVHFHYTQTSDGVWAIEVSTGEELRTYLIIYDVKNGPKMHNLVYRSGWGDGLLLYNNNQGEDENGKLPIVTSIYATEVQGLKKA